MCEHLLARSARSWQTENHRKKCYPVLNHAQADSGAAGPWAGKRAYEITILQSQISLPGSQVANHGKKQIKNNRRQSAMTKGVMPRTIVIIGTLPTR